MQPKRESTSWHCMTFAGRVPAYVMRREENSNRSSFCLGTYPFKPPSATLDANSEFGARLTIESGLSRYSNFHSLGVRMGDHSPTTWIDYPQLPTEFFSRVFQQLSLF